MVNTKYHTGKTVSAAEVQQALPRFRLAITSGQPMYRLRAADKQAERIMGALTNRGVFASEYLLIPDDDIATWREIFRRPHKGVRRPREGFKLGASIANRLLAMPNYNPATGELKMLHREQQAPTFHSEEGPIYTGVEDVAEPAVPATEITLAAALRGAWDADPQGTTSMILDVIPLQHIVFRVFATLEEADRRVGVLEAAEAQLSSVNGKLHEQVEEFRTENAALRAKLDHQRGDDDHKPGLFSRFRQ